MDEGVIAIVMFFSFLGAVILVPILAKERTRRSAHDLISQAMARGQVLEPGLIAKLSEEIMQEGNRARKSLGNGVILLALAGGFLASGYVIDSSWGHDGDGDVVHGMMVPAVLLGTVGAAFLLLAIFDYATKKRD